MSNEVDLLAVPRETLWVLADSRLIFAYRTSQGWHLCEYQDEHHTLTDHDLLDWHMVRWFLREQRACLCALGKFKRMVCPHCQHLWNCRLSWGPAAVPSGERREFHDRWGWVIAVERCDCPCHVEPRPGFAPDIRSRARKVAA